MVSTRTKAHLRAKLRYLTLILLALLLLCGILIGLFMKVTQLENTDRELIQSIRINNTPAAIAALRNGANPNTREQIAEQAPPNFQERLKRVFVRLWRSKSDTTRSRSRTALLLHFFVSKQDNPVLVKAMLEAGADPNAVGYPIDVSPVIIAARSGYAQSLRLLLQHGGKPNQTAKDHISALSVATMSHNTECLSLLLDAGADINVQNSVGGTPLFSACVVDNLPAVQLLLQHHANVNLIAKSSPTRQGKTALDIALLRGDKKLINLLRKAGARTEKELHSSSPPQNPN